MLNILAGNTICKQVKMLSEREKEVMSKIQFYVSISGASVLFYGRKRSVMFDMVKREKEPPKNFALRNTPPNWLYVLCLIQVKGAV